MVAWDVVVAVKKRSGQIWIDLFFVESSVWNLFGSLKEFNKS